MPVGVYQRTDKHIAICRQGGIASNKFKDAEWRKRVSDKMKQIQNTPENKLRISQQSKERWQDPVIRNKAIDGISRATKKQWKDNDNLRIAVNKSNYLRRLPIEELRLRRKKSVLRNHEKNIEQWRLFFAHIQTCDCCGKQITFSSGEKNTAIHFDHCHGHTKIRPSSWLRAHSCIEKNQKIWQSFKFGILCKECNQRIPTGNRQEWLINVTKYIEKTTSTLLHAGTGPKGS